RAREEERLKGKALRETSRQLTRVEWLLLGRETSLSQSEWYDGHIDRARELLEGCRFDFRGWEHPYLHTLLNKGPLAPSRPFVPVLVRVRFSSDGRRLVVADYTGRTTVYDPGTGREVLFFQTDENPSVLCVSPDGERVVTIGRDKVVKVWDTRSGKVTLT